MPCLRPENRCVPFVFAITDQGGQVNANSDTVSVQITATDTATGTLSFSASSLPTGLSISSSTGLISGTVGSSASTNSPYTATITVTDGTHTVVDVFNWTINPAGAVVLTSPGNQTNAKGDAVAFFVQASHANGATLMFSATGLPSGLSLNPSTALIFGTISTSAASSNIVTLKESSVRSNSNARRIPH